MSLEAIQRDKKALERELSEKISEFLGKHNVQIERIEVHEFKLLFKPTKPEQLDGVLTHNIEICCSI